MRNPQMNQSRPSLVAPLHGQLCDPPPIWLMRQAGRYLPEYRALRARAGSFLELCYTPDLATEITLQPVRRYGMDGAIVFSDILVVPDALGSEVSFVEGVGPKLTPLGDDAAVGQLSMARLAEHLTPVYDAVRSIRAALPVSTALIGFAGAPWTLAAYMLEGEGSKEFLRARTFALRHPDTFGRLLDLLTEAVVAHLSAQIEAGAAVVQLFDSWAGVLPEPQFEAWCLRPAGRIVAALKDAHPEVPVIVFPRGAGAKYAGYVLGVGPAGVSLDTSVPLAWARDTLGDVCLQGNLDPATLVVGGSTMRREVGRILATMAGRRFIFNLGHGVLPETDPDNVAELIEMVRTPRAEADGA
jgi:uroporphyrinogen decarboxylase